jgi:hypothetical protein
MREQKAEPSNLGEIGEPCAVKAARTVRRGAVRNVLSNETIRKDF